MVLAFTAALGSLLADPARRADLGRAARRRAAEAFSLEAVGRQLREVLLRTGFLPPSGGAAGTPRRPNVEPSTRSG